MKLLHLDSSILGDASASRQLSHSVVAAWLAAEPTASLSYRDLAADALSHFSAASLVAAGTATELRDAAQQHEAELAESTLQECFPRRLAPRELVPLRALRHLET